MLSLCNCGTKTTQMWIMEIQQNVNIVFPDNLEGRYLEYEKAKKEECRSKELAFTSKSGNQRITLKVIQSSPGVEEHTYNPNVERQRQKEQEFEDSLR